MNEQAAGQPKWRNTLVLLKQRHHVGRKPGTVGTQEAKAWRNRLFLSMWGNHLEQRVLIHGAWSLESVCIFTRD